jgi:hypothetical protein
MDKTTAAKKAAFKDFTDRLTILMAKHPNLVTTTLSNIFTMRLIGNKTHGDMAEIAIAEFVNQYMYDFESVHVGKDLYRAKSHEEDIKIINQVTKEHFSVSLKAYGDGPLQLSTDKNFLMFPRLEREGGDITSKEKITAVFEDAVFSDFHNINVLPLIYDEKKQLCNILVFDYDLACRNTARIAREGEGRGRKHAVFRFYDDKGDYICEVRYGDAAANALQRGLWTNTKRGLKYFNSITSGWISYSHNPVLVKLFSQALVSSTAGHSSALEVIKRDIELLKKTSGLP